MSQALYSFYGDDFTGSTDVLEGLSIAGVGSVLFLGAPSPGQLEKFNDCQAFGIAGDSRSRSPEWMDEHLPAVFERLRSFGAPVVHYKTCSTFDSSPRVGSIGRAMEIGLRTFKSAFVPVVVAAPHLKRYVVFGNLFAAGGNEVYRIDRHPTMSRHPVTPMHEADLRLHLAQQTRMRVGLIDLPTLQSGLPEEALSARLKAGDQAVVFDGVERYGAGRGRPSSLVAGAQGAAVCRRELGTDLRADLGLEGPKRHPGDPGSLTRAGGGSHVGDERELLSGYGAADRPRATQRL